MDGFSVYKYYLAMKFHFTVPGYDVFKHKGRVRANESNYQEKGLRFRMESLGRRFKTPQDAVSFFLACNLYGADVFNDVESSEAWITWKKRSEMMTRFIMDDIAENCSSTDPESVAKAVSGGKLSYESAVAINRIFNIVPILQENFIYSKIGDRITKLDKFIKYDESKVQQFIQEEYEQTT